MKLSSRKELIKEANLILKKIRIKEGLVKEDEAEEKLKQILKANYATFVKELGDNIKDDKFVAALETLKDKLPLQTKNAYILVKNLKPSQNEVVLDNSLSYPLTDPASAELYLKGGNVDVAGKKIITGGGGKFIIDGHHRWSQLYCINPDAKIGVRDLTDVSGPIKALKATQIGIAVKLKKIPTEPGGGINLFGISENTLKEYVVKKIKEPVVAIFKKYKKGNTPEEIADFIWKNVQILNKNSKPNDDAPNREIMPQTGEAPEWVDNTFNVEKIPESIMKFSSRTELMKEASIELKKILREAEEIGKDVQTALTKITKFSDEGHSTEALLELAKLLKSKKHETILKAIQDITEAAETMPYMVEKYREEVGRELSLLCREKLNNKEFAAIYAAM